MAGFEPASRASFCVPPPPGKNAELDLGQAEPCALARHDDIGAERKFQPAAERVAFDCRDQRLAAFADDAPIFFDIGRHDLGRLRLHHFADVGAGGEGRVRAGDDQAADFWRTQSQSNRSLLRNSPLTGKRTGIISIMGCFPIRRSC
jgi:hypothetical protein